MAKAAKLGQIYVEINARLEKLEGDLKKGRRISEQQTRLMQRTFDKINFKRARSSLMNFNRLLLAVATGYGLKRIASSAIETAASFEQMQVKLDQLTGGRGKQTLEELNKWALEMPVNTQKAVETFIMMKAYGLDPNIQSLQTLVDVAMIFGEDAMPRVARALGQLQARGKLSAQEIMQLSEVGINANKYLVDAFGMGVEGVKKAGIDINTVIQAIIKGMDKDFGGSAQKMMKSWQGLTSVFRSYIVEIERKVMAAGVFDLLKHHLDSINSRLGDWIKNNDQLITQKVDG